MQSKSSPILAVGSLQEADSQRASSSESRLVGVGLLG